jgi:hypothetical protein
VAVRDAGELRQKISQVASLRESRKLRVGPPAHVGQRPRPRGANYFEKLLRALARETDREDPHATAALITFANYVEIKDAFGAQSVGDGLPRPFAPLSAIAAICTAPEPPPIAANGTV